MCYIRWCVLVRVARVRDARVFLRQSGHRHGRGSFVVSAGYVTEKTGAVRLS